MPHGHLMTLLIAPPRGHAAWPFPSRAILPRAPCQEVAATLAKAWKSPLRLYLTGRLAAELGDARFDERRLPGRQGRRAFAYLALERTRPVPIDELADAVWRTSTPAAAWETALSAIVSKLRSCLRAVDSRCAVTTAAGCYQLALPAEAWVDVEASASPRWRARTASILSPPSSRARSSSSSRSARPAGRSSCAPTRARAIARRRCAPTRTARSCSPTSWVHHPRPRPTRSRRRCDGRADSSVDARVRRRTTKRRSRA